MLEKDLEQYFMKQIKECRDKTLCFKFLSAVAGVPDRIIVSSVHGTLFVELKTDTGRLREIQKIQIRNIKDLKGQVVVVYGKKGIDQFFSDFNDRFVLNEIYPTQISRH